MAKEKKQRINITIDPWLLISIDIQALNLNYSRSQFITRCIMFYIKNYKGDEDK